MRSIRHQRQRSQGFAIAELVLALGILFTGAWSIMELGGAACLVYFKYVASTVHWPLL
ncbi:MAG: hypothetical protein AAGD11_20390 [Planctomycetota bacterium]